MNTHWKLALLVMLSQVSMSSPLHAADFFKGTIGTHPVRVLFNDYWKEKDASAEGRYQYQNGSGVLEFEGKWDPKSPTHLLLRESTSDEEKTTGRFDLNLNSNGNLSGKWHSAKGGKTLPVSLHPVKIPQPASFRIVKTRIKRPYCTGETRIPEIQSTDPRYTRLNPTLKKWYARSLAQAAGQGSRFPSGCAADFNLKKDEKIPEGSDKRQSHPFSRRPDFIDCNPRVRLFTIDVLSVDLNCSLMSGLGAAHPANSRFTLSIDVSSGAVVPITKLVRWSAAGKKEVLVPDMDHGMKSLGYFLDPLGLHIVHPDAPFVSIGADRTFSYSEVLKGHVLGIPGPLLKRVATHLSSLK